MSGDGPTESILDRELLAKACTELPGPVPEVPVEVLDRFCVRVVRENRFQNLTRITDPAGVTLKHLVDSLAVACFASFAPGARALDIGSGAGFPGCVLAALFPEVNWTLVESNGKKAGFLERQRDLFPNICVVRGRVETLGRDPNHRRSYDRVVCRAVGPPPVVLEYALPLLVPGGILVALYGTWDPERSSEVFEIARGLGAAEWRVHTYRLPVLGHQRSALVVTQGAECPDAYPRPPGRATKRPLRPECFT